MLSGRHWTSALVAGLLLISSLVIIGSTSSPAQANVLITDDFPQALANYATGGWQGPYGDGTGGTVVPTADGQAIYLDGTYNSWAWAMRQSPEVKDLDLSINLSVVNRDNTVADGFMVMLRFSKPNQPTACCDYVSAQSGLRLYFRIGSGILAVVDDVNYTQMWSTATKANLSFSTGQPHTVRVVYQGTSLWVYLDSLLVVNLQTKDYPAGLVGFGAYRVDMTVDSLSLEANASAPPSQVFIPDQVHNVQLSLYGGSIGSPTVLHVADQWLMYYVNSNDWSIHMANSTNGIIFRPLPNPVLNSSPSAPILTYLDSMSLGSSYQLWYSVYNGSAYTIYRAVSSDGFNWTSEGMVLDQEYDNGTAWWVFSPSVLWDGTMYRLWYTTQIGWDNSFNQIRYATSSDGFHWDRHGVVMGPLYSGNYDSQGPRIGNVLASNDGFVLWYACTPYNQGSYSWQNALCRAKSSDGVIWTREGAVLTPNPANPQMDIRIATVDAAQSPNGTVRLWFGARGSSSWDNIFTGTTTTASVPIPMLSVSAVASPFSGTAPLYVQLSASASGGVAPYSFTWDFGDGTYEYHQSVVHTYFRPGTYKLVVTATDSTGSVGGRNQVANASLSVTVSAPPQLANYSYGGWSAYGDPTAGTVSVAPDGSSILMHATYNAEAWLVRNPPELGNFDMRVRMTLTNRDYVDAEHLWFLLRWHDPTYPTYCCDSPHAASGLWLDFNVGRGQVRVFDERNYTTVFSTANNTPLNVSYDEPHEFRMVYLDDTLSVFLDSNPILTMKTTALPPGQVGIIAYRFDSLVSQVTLREGLHDVALTGVKASPTEAVVGDPVTIQVGVVNRGDFPETTSVESFVDGAPAAPVQPVSLAPKATSTLSFTWDTRAFPVGDHTISARVAQVADEVDISNNALADGQVRLFQKTLTVELSGQFDYLLREAIPLRVVAQVKDASNMQLVSGATVAIHVYDPKGKVIFNETMVEKIPGSGIYDWTSTKTLRDLNLPKGIYLVRVQASYRGGPVTQAVVLFHIDPPGEDGGGQTSGGLMSPVAIASLTAMISVAATVVVLQVRTLRPKRR